MPKSVIMSQFSIGKSTLNEMLRSKEKFKKFRVEKVKLGLTEAAKTVKKVEGGYFDKLDSALYIWFRQEREKCCPVTGQILSKKVSEFHRLIYSEKSRPFPVSARFQWKFFRSFSLRNLKICGEKLSSDSSYAEQFVNEFSGITEGYSKNQFFNCNETGL